jgi:hypothetical protein
MFINETEQNKHEQNQLQRMLRRRKSLKTSHMCEVQSHMLCPLYEEIYPFYY